MLIYINKRKDEILVNNYLESNPLIQAIHLQARNLDFRLEGIVIKDYKKI